MVTTDQLRKRLRRVDDPALGGDIVSLGLVTDVRIDERAATATVQLAFNAPLSPAEWELCDQIRALCRGIGLEPHLYADDGTEHPVFDGVKNTIAIVSVSDGTDADTGGTAHSIAEDGTARPGLAPSPTPLVTANVVSALLAAGARIGVLDTTVAAAHETWLDTVASPEQDTDSIIPPHVGDVPVLSLRLLASADAESPGPDTVDRNLSSICDSVEWGSLDYLFVALPTGAGPIARRVLEEVSADGSVVVAPSTAPPSRVRETVRTLRTGGETVLGVCHTTDEDVPLDSSIDRWNDGRSPDDPGDDGAVPVLGTVPLDRVGCETDRHPRSSRERLPPPTVTAATPFRRLAAAIADRTGAVNRRRVAASRAG